jgi:hypothetical protein
VTRIGGNAFHDCKSLTLITNLNPVPVSISGDWVFEGVEQNACTLEVPINSVSAYKNAFVWRKFNIVGIEVGIEPIETDVVKIYPNPTSGELFIEMSDMRCKTCDIEIFDVMGRNVGANPCVRPNGIGQSEIGKSEINISHLPSGIYFVRIQTENGTITRKVVKN